MPTSHGLLTSLPTVEEVLDNHASELAHDFIAYRSHVYRVVNLCLAIVGESRVEFEKLAVAAVFHDLGIWTNNTFDDGNNAPRITESLDEQLNQAAEELITGDSDDPPLSEEAVLEMIKATHMPKRPGL